MFVKFVIIARENILRFLPSNLTAAFETAMTTWQHLSEATTSGRKILISVNASAESEDALQWTLHNLYRPGDVLHFLHVVPRQEPATTYGAPPVDFLPHQNPDSFQKLAEEAQSFIKDRLLPMLGDMQPDPVVHVIKVY